jgi:hypothetical protein
LRLQVPLRNRPRSDHTQSNGLRHGVLNHL